MLFLLFWQYQLKCYHYFLLRLLRFLAIWPRIPDCVTSYANEILWVVIVTF